MDIFQERREADQVEPGAALVLDAEGLACDLAAEGELLEIDETRRPFQIGQRCRITGLQTLEFAAAGDLELQDVDELRM